MDGDFSVLDPDDVEQEPFAMCDVRHRKLTEALGCTEMRINTATLEPGEATPPHAHEGQEEVYIALTGGRVEIDGEAHDVPEGGVVRVGPEPIRAVRNDTDDEIHRWVMVGAPPVGTVEDFGNTVLPGEESP
ncbi:cupin domain-containing protein [Halogeometricum sp. S1BR25-6]|uniref:Cupin domain-containing protein n=1 Tax=Halogeometricum salsisoli TaxID=2950536 RepID=A0ABU2GAW1_9EURY|nr:cupin domain-containing protein [Halogeometricum sp. S1BR25-6]MDS0297278.1 cupin domain-containing protein [Halogeometricum sp. S1BR25-6]